jgi:hypothetical protein
MRTYSIIAVALLLAGILAGWVILNLRAKARYDKARQAIGPPFLLGTLDSRDEALLAEAKEHWKCMYDAKSESAKVLVIAGYEPTVAGLTALLTYSLPQYSWISSVQNNKATRVATAQTLLFPISTDHTVHAAADRHTALIILMDRQILVFEDSPSGLRESSYARVEEGDQTDVPSRAPTRKD